MTKSHADVRNFYESFVEMTMLGPGLGIDGRPDLEELLNPGDLPSRVYSTGIIYPHCSPDVTDTVTDNVAADEASVMPEPLDDVLPEAEVLGSAEPQSEDPDEFVASRASEFMPSATGASFLLAKGSGVSVEITLGTYRKISLKSAGEKTITRYRRQHISDVQTWSHADIEKLNGSKRTDSKLIKGLPSDMKGKLHIYVR